MKPADSVLLEAWIVKRDAEAFAQLVKRYAGLVYSAAVRVLGNAAEAEDVSQDCFLVLADAELPGPKSLPAWLHVVATRRALNKVRNDQARQRRERAQLDQAANCSNPDWDDIESFIDEAIGELPDEIRFAVTAHFLLQRTHRSIAKESGVARQTVTRRITKGVEEVRLALAQRGITAPATLLGALLAENASGAVPEQLISNLGKVAVAGSTGNEIPVTATTFALPVPALKIWFFSMVIILLALAGYISRNQTHSNSTSDISATDGDTILKNSPSMVRTAASAPTEGKKRKKTSTRKPDDQSATPAVNPGRQIYGMVYDLSTGQPLSNIHVKAEYKRVHYLPSGLTKTELHSRNAITDSVGQFHITNLNKRKYKVYASYDVRELVGEWPEVDLWRQHEARDVKIGVSEFHNGMAVIKGQIIQGNHEFFERQTIQVDYDSTWNEETRKLEKPRSENAPLSATGEFVVGNLAEGTVKLAAFEPGTGSDRGRIMQFIEIEKGQDYEIDFRFPVRSNGRIEGHIALPSESKRAIIHAFTDNRDGYTVTWGAISSTEGDYALYGLPEGNFEIIVHPEAPYNRSFSDEVVDARMATNYPSPYDIVRVSTGVWTPANKSAWNDFRNDPISDRPYFSSHKEAISKSSFHERFGGEFRRDFITLRRDQTTRLNFVFKNPSDDTSD